MCEGTNHFQASSQGSLVSFQVVSTAEGIFSLFLEESSTILCFWYTEKQFRDVHTHTFHIHFHYDLLQDIDYSSLFYIYRENLNLLITN